MCRIRIARILNRARQHYPCPCKTLDCVFCRFMVPADVGSGVRVAYATAKFEIRCGPFAVSPQVSGACSFLEVAIVGGSLEARCCPALEAR